LDRVKHTLVVHFVDTDYLRWFCKQAKRRDLNKLCKYHANCLVRLKIKRVRLFGLCGSIYLNLYSLTQHTIQSII
jgi:hypothetical protein